MKTTNSVTPLTTSGPTGLTPQQISQAYGFNKVTFAGGVAGDGSGTTIAIVDAYDDPNIAHDLHQFDLAFGLPDPQFTKVNQTGGSTFPSANSGWITEIALDVEWAHAIAPKANILLVEANTSSLSDLMTAVNYARQAPGVVVLSMSWAAGEFSSETSFDSQFTTPAGHAGVSFVVASGDSGSPVSYPAASNNVLAVGGTSLYLSQGNYSSESGWSGSGGGISAYETQPAYQQGVVTQSTTRRTNPDVSYDSNPNTGFPVYDSFNNGTITPWGQWGGTSDAAPQWAALIAIADQGRMLSGLGSLDGSTQLLPALYQLPSTDFHDVTTGSSLGNPNYSAGPGYDLVTGRGTPIANLVVTDLVGGATASVPTHFGLSLPTAILSGQSFNVTVSALTATNSVSSNYLGTILFSTIDPATGVVLPASYTFTAADQGTHTFTGVILKTPGAETITVRDTVNSTMNGLGSVTVSLANQPPTLGGITPLTYIKGQAAAAICPAMWVGDNETSTIASAVVKILNPVNASDALSFVNNNSYLYGNITGDYNATNSILTLTSAGSTALVWQFQAALRAVTYFNRDGISVAAGTRAVTFQVNDGFNVSQIATTTITITNASTTTSFPASAESYSFSQTVQLVVAVSVVAPGQGIPTGGTGGATVQFFDGSTAIAGPVTYSIVNGQLTATLSTSSLSLGAHSITAVYSGDASRFGSTSAPMKVSIVPAVTSCALTSSTTWPYYGSALTLTAVIRPISPGNVAPPALAGVVGVTFRDGGNVIPGTVSYSTSNGNLIARLTTTSLATGLHLITAVYSGGAGFTQSLSPTIKQVVLYAVTSTSLTAPSSSIAAGQPVTLTATIGVVGAGAGVPTIGAGVQFLDGNAVISGTVTYSIANGKLIATLTTKLRAGAHTIKVEYFGDANFSASFSNSLKLQIDAK